jgi:hypothetical protein
MKTTILGSLTIILALANAAVNLLKGGPVDFAATGSAVAAGIGLVKAADSTSAK